MSSFDRIAVAERLRGLIGGQDQGDLGATAARLGIEEVSLRMSIDAISPHPTVEVLAAVIRVYGVDPTWLLTGVYDAATHRSAMEREHRMESKLRDFMTSRTTPIAEPPLEQFRQHEHN